MSEADHKIPLTVLEAISELDRIHTEEARVLRSPNRTTLDELADRKLAVCECLRDALQKGSLRPEEIAALRKLRKTALLNQVLLLHARDTVFGVLEIAGAVPPSTSKFNRGSAVQDGVKVNFRG